LPHNNLIDIFAFDKTTRTTISRRDRMRNKRLLRLNTLSFQENIIINSIKKLVIISIFIKKQILSKIENLIVRFILLGTKNEIYKKLS